MAIESRLVQSRLATLSNKEERVCVCARRGGEQGEYGNKQRRPFPVMFVCQRKRKKYFHANKINKGAGGGRRSEIGGNF